MPEPPSPSADQYKAWLASVDTQVCVRVGAAWNKHRASFEILVIHMYQTGAWKYAELAAVVDENGVVTQYHQPKDFREWFDYVTDNAGLAESAVSVLRFYLYQGKRLEEAGIGIDALVNLPKVKQQIVVPALKKALADGNDEKVRDLFDAAQNNNASALREIVRGEAAEKIIFSVYTKSNGRQVIYLEGDQALIGRALTRMTGVLDYQFVAEVDDDDISGIGL